MNSLFINFSTFKYFTRVDFYKLNVKEYEVILKLAFYQQYLKMLTSLYTLPLFGIILVICCCLP